MGETIGRGGDTLTSTFSDGPEPRGVRGRHATQMRPAFCQTEPTWTKPSQLVMSLRTKCQTATPIATVAYPTDHRAPVAMSE